jgi:hypothetical protein
MVASWEHHICRACIKRLEPTDTQFAPATRAREGTHPWCECYRASRPKKETAMSNDGLENKVQNEGSKPDALKERLAGRNQDQMILDKEKEVNEAKEKGEGNDSIKEVTSNSILSP